MEFENKAVFIDYWAATIKKGDIIEFDRWDGEVQTAYVIQNNYRSVWYSYEPNSQPPYTSTVTWNDILRVLTKEEHPEYYL